MCSLTMGALAAARDSTELDAVWSSIETQRKGAAEGVIPTRIALEYVVEWHFPIDPGALAAMKAKAKSLPDHPSHADIEMHEAYLRDGPRQHKTRVWASENGLLRSSVDYLYGSTPYTDSAYGPSNSWMLSASALTIADKDGVLAPPTRNPAQVASSKRGEAVSILYGAFNFAPAVQARRDRLGLREDRWKLTFDYPIGGTVLLEGRWDAETKTALATRATLQNAPRFERGLIAIRSEDWVYQEALSLWTPRIVEFDSGPSQYRVLIISSVDSVPQTELEALTRTPTLDEPDPIRGVLTVRSVFDYEAEPASDALLTSAGALAVDTQADAGMLARFRWLAFGAAASLAVLLIAIRARKSRIRVQASSEMEKSQ